MSNEQYLVRRLLNGIAGWLTFQQAAGRKTLYCEHYLYAPIHAVAQGRLWSVHAQGQIKRQRGAQGASKAIDFIFFRTDTDEYDQGLLLLEVKYLRGSNRTTELSGIASDIIKLRSVNASGVKSAKT